MGIYKRNTRFVNGNTAYFTFHQSEYHAVLHSDKGVDVLYAKAVLDTNYATGASRMRWNGTENLSLAGWKALGRRGLAYYNAPEDRWRLNKRKSGNTVKVCIHDIQRIAFKQITFVRYHTNTLAAKLGKEPDSYFHKWKRQCQYSQRAASKTRGTHREGSNETLKPWVQEGISRRTWYRKRAKNDFGTTSHDTEWHYSP